MDVREDLPSPDYDEQARRTRLAYVGLTERDRELLREVAESVGSGLDVIADAFYDHLMRFEATRSLLRDAQQVAGLKERHKEYLLEMLRGPYDEAYFQSRWHIGAVHNQVHVEPQWYLGAYQIYRRLLFPLVASRHAHDAAGLVERLLAIDKVMALDMAIGLDSYWAHYTAAIDRMQALNAEIRAASEAKSQFLANMSHEFRTPLNAILGFAEVLQDQLAGPLNEQQVEYLEDVHRAGQVLLRLINDVLDLAKIEAGRLELFYETFSVGQAIREAVTVVRGAAEKRNLALRLQLAPDLGTIRADQVRFKQVLYNLLSNAVKFTENGSVTVAARIEEDQLHVQVEDTGVGIRDEDKERIFLEFSQLDSSHARLHEGTGLGLALSKRLVEAHEGRIWLESRYGVGSTFHVQLPLAPRAGAP